MTNDEEFDEWQKRITQYLKSKGYDLDDRPYPESNDPLDWSFWTIELVKHNQEQIHEKIQTALWEQEWGVGGW